VASKPASALVVVVDRLGAGFLGPYGNTWVETPQFNRLASESLVCETALADAAELPLAYRAWWTGRHALEPAMDARPPLPQAASDAALGTLLITDEREVAEFPESAAFGKRVVVAAPPATQAAQEIDETTLGRLFVAASEQVRSLDRPSLVWLHARGMAGPWDAPSALRQQFADEDDPLPPDFVDPPRRYLAEGSDPDELLGLVQAYAGQVALADVCLGLLLDAIDESPLADALVAVTSPRGYPLGEHRRVGGSDLFGELVHVPLVVRLPGGRNSAWRLQGLVQPPDLFATLAEWLGLPGAASAMFAQSLLPAARGEPWRERPLACVTGRAQRLVRSPAWQLREVVVDDEICRQLYAKPDDRWEANEVSARCGEVVELLATAADQFRQAAAAGTAGSFGPLADVLCDIRR
jgi:arylsulfatase A-like enzyme